MIKKYRAGTFTEAFQRIKEELGPDAVILQQQELKNSKNPSEKVEVTVTLDDISEVPPATGAATGTYNSRGVKPGQTGGNILQKKEKAPEPSGYMESVLAEVKKLREEFATTRSDFLEGVRVVRDKIPKEFASIAAELSRNGLPAQTVHDLLAETMLLCPVGSRDDISIKEQM